ncbi:MAG: Holliday junction branch migration protein RuvA [Clostridiales bacterium]|jgi:Holliday junction DNA helicase RuvA|nr:Holliday junction branch migration protein RuvA [Clostridiales bacterium]
MYEYIVGKLVDTSQNFAVVDVGGVGYKMITSQMTLNNVGIGDEVKFYAYLHVREDIFDIYGFSTKEERATFLMLISISGVGPKAALSILSVVTSQELAIAVAAGNSKVFTKASGVGPKMAGRIVLELKDKVQKEHLKGASCDLAAGVGVGALPGRSNILDAESALMVLGYNISDAQSAIGEVLESVENASEIDTETIIKEALRLMK